MNYFGWLGLHSENIIESKPFNASKCIPFLSFLYSIQWVVFIINLLGDTALNLLIYVFQFGKY